MPTMVLVGNSTPSASLQHVAWFVHLPKTGGSSVAHLFTADHAGSCSLTKSCGNSTGPRGGLIVAPYQLGLATMDEWTTALCVPRLLDAARRVIWRAQPARLGSVSGACNSRWQPFVRASLSQASPAMCPDNLHWPAALNLEIAARIRRAGAQPVVLITVRNPFQWLASVFFHSLRGVVPRNDSVTSYTICAGAPRERRGLTCRPAFHDFLTDAVARESTLTEAIRHYLGTSPLDLVPPWAWIRQENLADDLARVFERATGRPYPSDRACALPVSNAGQQGSEACYASLYTPELAQRVVAADDWVFRRFGYARSPEGACSDENRSFVLPDVTRNAHLAFPARAASRAALHNWLEDVFPKTVGVRSRRLALEDE